MKIGRNKSTMKQMAYARQIWGAQGKSKRQIALNSGYSPSVANSITYHIESKPGFKSAMSALATESNNLAVSVMYEFKKRGFTDFSNKELIGALNAIGNAWSKFNEEPKTRSDGQQNNRLRTVILQQVENQVVNNPEHLNPPEVLAAPEGVASPNPQDPFDF
jgi:DNA-binding CsgD family transcriptional regulator